MYSVNGIIPFRAARLARRAWALVPSDLRDADHRMDARFGLEGRGLAPDAAVLAAVGLFCRAKAAGVGAPTFDVVDEGHLVARVNEETIKWRRKF